MPARASLPRAFLAGALAAATALVGGSRAEGGPPDLAAALKGYRRPPGVPFPATNPYSEAKLALGGRIFLDRNLSRDRSVACAGCHDPLLAFADGVRLGTGIAGRRLDRHTPHLWNLAWGTVYFWDGRARSIEAQLRGPLTSPREMGAELAVVTRRLDRDASYRQAFAAAFPGRRRVETDMVLAALATYVRSLVSPRTAFDAWVGGEARAIDAQAKAGFRLFTGKAACANCHAGWAFTDRAFHDIGLPGTDRGRGAVLGLPVADHAFQTPTLRELAWTAPYMHDGSLPTLEAVIEHYEHGIVERPSLSPDLKRIDLTPAERGQLLAFLATLSSADPPLPELAVPAAAVAPPVAVAATTISQKDKMFRPAAVRLHAGETLTIVNDDSRTHNVRSDTGAHPFNSGAQEPGQSVRMPFGVPGTYEVYCGIHPAMQLTIEVTR